MTRRVGFLWATTMLAGVLGAGTQALAQAAPSTQSPTGVSRSQPSDNSAPQRDNTEQVGEVVVTGSRILRPNLESPTPISTLSPQQIQNAGTVNLGDIIATLPQVGFTGTTRSNSNSFGNNAGLSQVNLRNLGANRTLVLVDGQRHVAGDISSNAVDLNSIPASLVDHVEVVTGGASAIYGSDAVTGVVNIILKKNFEGVDAQAQVGGFDAGFGQTYNGYITVGHSFMDGKLNVTATGFYDNEEGFYLSNIPSSHNYGFVVNPNDIPAGTFDSSFFSAGAPITKDGIPDRLLAPNVGSDLLSRNGVLLDANTFLPITAFDAKGNPVPQVARTGYNSFAFGQLPANCTTCYFADPVTQDRSPLQSYGGDLRVNYDFNPHLHFNLDAKIVEAVADNTVQGSYTFGDYQLTPDNAFLTPAIRSLLPTDAASYPYYSAFLTDGRKYEVTRDTFRIVAALSGDFDTKLAKVNWDGALNYGRTNTRFENFGLRITDNFQAALDSVVDPRTGQAACRINVPSAAAAGLAYAATGEGNASNPQACVPFNPFGQQNGAGAYGYSFGNFNTYDSLTQQVANLNLTFDTSRFFNLQGGPVSFAVGGEYRMERTKELNDSALLAGTTENLAANSSGGFNVGEGYIEASAPIFKHFAPGLDEWTIDAAYRGSEYSTVGHTDAYKFSTVYGPFTWIKVRGTYSRAVRAPNITEAFLPESNGFFNITDPCDVSNITGNVNYPKNCAAQGIPVGFKSNTNSSIQGTTSGNPNLDPEKSISYTGGFVLQPSFIPHLSVTLDYYSIKIKNAITNVAAQDIINNCYNGPSLDSQYCSLFTRAANGNINSVQTTFVNAAKLETDGFDLQANYAVGVSGLTSRWAYSRFLDGRLNFNLSANYLMHLRNFPFQNQPSQVNILEGAISSFGDNPHLKGLADITYAQGPVQVSWQTRYLGRAARFDRDDTQVDKSESTDVPFANAKFTHNIVVRYRLPERLLGAEIFGGINDIFNERPPIGIFDGTSGASGDAAYDLGRYLFGGIRIRR